MKRENIKIGVIIALSLIVIGFVVCYVLTPLFSENVPATEDDLLAFLSVHVAILQVLIGVIVVALALGGFFMFKKIRSELNKLKEKHDNFDCEGRILREYYDVPSDKNDQNPMVEKEYYKDES